MTDATNETAGPLEFVEKPITAALTATQAPEDADLEMSIFSGGFDIAASGKPVYTFTIRHGKYEFYANPLSIEDLQYVTEQGAELEKAGLAIAKLKTPAEQQAAGEAVAAQSVERDKWVIEKSLVGWYHPDWKTPVPFNAENRAKVDKSVWAKLTDEITGRSWSGRGRADAAANF